MELVVDNLGCVRGGRVVLAGLSFTAKAGCPVLLRGPNGVGKSTLLRVLAGLLSPASGVVRLGEIVLSDRSAFQEHVAYAGHLDAIKPALSVRQNLDLWAGILGADMSRTDEALARFALDAIADRPAVQCSAGQKRRLGLARLVVVRRPLWLLDEPTVSLDTASASVVAQLVDAHCRAGGLALIATHIDMGLAASEMLEMAPPAVDLPGADAFLDGDWT